MPVWGVDEASTRLAIGASADHGGLLTEPWLVIAGIEQLDAPALDALRSIPAVTIGIRTASGSGSGDQAPTNHDPRPSLGVDLVAADRDEADALVARVMQRPQASLVATQVLRAAAADPVDGLVLESLAYATLQGGAEHRAWLDEQGRRVRRPDESPAVLVEDDGDLIRLTLNRPRLRNPLTAQMRDELRTALEGLAVAADGRPIELRGAGRCFCIGGDLAEFGTVADPASAHQIRMVANVAPALIAVADRVTVRLHGACVGAGVELAAFASTVVATPDATFRLPELSLGLIPGAGGTVSLPPRIGRAATLRWLLTDEVWSAEQAVARGLVDRVEPLPDSMP